MDGGVREQWLLRHALVRLLSRIATHLQRQRQRGRTATSDALAAYAIEEGEAEGLIAELRGVLGSEATIEKSLVRDELVAIADLPLPRAVLAFDLTASELHAVVLAIAVELDSRFARLIAYMNDHVARTRPTLGLAYALEANGLVEASVLERPFVRDGLVELDGTGPLSGQEVKIAQAMLPRFAADEVLHAGPLAHVRLVAPDETLAKRLVLKREVEQALGAWIRGEPRPLLIAGGQGVGRGTCARAVLGGAGCAAIEVEIDGPVDLAARMLVARREARWFRAAIIVRLGADWPNHGAAALWGALHDVAGPIVITTTTVAIETLAEAAPVEPAIVTLSAPDLGMRARLWRSLLPPSALTSAEIDELAARFELTPRTMACSIRRAKVAGLGSATLQQAAREVGASSMSSIAQRLPLIYTRADLVLPPRILTELDLAISWLRHKRQVFETWGFGRRVALGRGLTAMFAGPPGTGKTMTAQVLAKDLGLDLYRVDLSRVMSKYIGETEKNLSRLFDEAQASGAVLFFDEADALFGKRSEVRDAHDRYANVEIGYLLQRMEEHEGVAILATNRVGDLDEAFLRRFHFLLDFPMPDASYRLQLWQSMLPAQVDRAPGLDLTPLANAYELSGGEIRNCVIAAAYMAAEEGSRIEFAHLERGLRRELRKTGRITVKPRRRIVNEEV
jgi:ATPase family protein associated with various cellular activities (AAA)/winged helix domain-containing protein